MKGWVGLVGWPIADGLPTLVVTHQLQVERSTGKVRRPETDVLPVCHATVILVWCKIGRIVTLIVAKLCQRLDENVSFSVDASAQWVCRTFVKKIQPSAKIFRKKGCKCVFFTARCYASAVLAWPCARLCLSVCLCMSVTSRSSTKTAKRRITQTTPHDSPGTLVFWRQRSPRMPVGWVKIGDFRQIAGYISKTVQDRRMVSIKVE